MPSRIPYFELLRRLNDPSIPERDLRPYVTLSAAPTGPFQLIVVPNDETVIMTPDERMAEGALQFANQWCRLRRHGRARRRLEDNDPSPLFVSEGDSWFQFPFMLDDVIDQLESDYIIWSLGAAGDTLRNMVFGRPEYLRTLKRMGDRVSGFLFSAGGNDILGEDDDGNLVLETLLKAGVTNSQDPEAFLDSSRVSETFACIERAYREVVSSIRSTEGFEALPIIFHGYDYPIPACPGDRRNPSWAKAWLSGPLERREIRDPSLQRNILKVLVDRLYAILDAIASESSHVFVVDVRGTLPRVEDWADEIHPTDRGYAEVGAKFRSLMSAALTRGPAAVA